MDKIKLRDFIIYASGLIPEGEIYFCNPKDAALLVESIKSFEKAKLSGPAKKVISARISREMRMRMGKNVNIKEKQ